ncbi:hypothetical protein PTI98_009074 [Pleurotus ostreatus]|nr:hypothetical protein PTI98_009074 [Pleurotus ostreatus]
MTHAQLYELVRKHLNKWPKKSFSRSRLSKKDLWTELLNPPNGFKTDMPLPAAPVLVAIPAPAPTSIVIPAPPPIVIPAPAPVTIPAQVPHPAAAVVAAPIAVPPMPTPRAAPQAPPQAPIQAINQPVPSNIPLQSTFPVSAPSNLTSGSADNSRKRSIRPYIVDNRPNGSENMIQQIEVAMIDREGCAPGEWRADALEVFQQLQVSNAAITGRGQIKVGYVNSHDPDFVWWFLRGDLYYLLLSTPDPNRLIVSSDSKLQLRISTVLLPSMLEHSRSNLK